MQYFVGTNQPFTSDKNSEVHIETCSIGIQGDLLAAAPLHKFGTKSLEEPLSTSDTEGTNLDTSFQLIQEDTTTEYVQVFIYTLINPINTIVMTLRPICIY